jgi:hypothetical protein
MTFGMQVLMQCGAYEWRDNELTFRREATHPETGKVVAYISGELLAQMPKKDRVELLGTDLAVPWRCYKSDIIKG